MENLVTHVSTATGGYLRSILSISYNTNYCAICCTYIIYIYKLPNFELVESICNKNNEFITAKLSTKVQSLLIYITSNNSIKFYDFLAHDALPSSYIIHFTPIYIEFSKRGNKCYILSNRQGCFYAVWAYKTKVKEYNICSSIVSQLYNTQNREKSVIICFSSGYTALYNPTTKNFSYTGERDEVIQLKLDPLNESNCLFITKNSKWLLYIIEMNSLILITKANKTNVHISSGDWVPGSPGTIITGSADFNLLQYWSVSSGQLLETVELGENNIINITTFTSNLVGIHFMSGTVLVFDAISKESKKVITAGHVGPVFDALFTPCLQKTLVTYAADNHISLWEFPSLSRTSTFDASSSNKKLTCATLSPVEKYIITGYSDGSISLFSIDNNRMEFTEKIHNASIVSMDWCASKTSLICTACSDSSCVIYDITKKSRRCQMSIKRPLKRIRYSRTDSSIAIACGDGSLYIRIHSGLYFLIQTNKSAIYDISWHHTNPNVLAGVNHNGEAILFDIPTKSYTILQGHQCPARTVQWISSPDNIFITGGQDGNLIIWNSESLSKICTIKAHCSDINSISIHPRYPLFITTVSKDTTISIWSIERLFPKLKTRILLESSDNLKSEYLCPYEGSECLEKLASRISQGTKILYDEKDIPHMNDCLELTKLKAESILQGVCLDKDILQRSKQVRSLVTEAANLYLKASEYEKYCELNMILGNHDLALAAAPNVSYDYWKNLMEICASRNIEESSYYYLLSQNKEKAVNHFLDLNEFDNALVAAIVPPIIPESKTSRVKNESLSKPFITDFHDETNLCIYNIGSKCSAHLLNEGKILQAASVLLSVGDVENACYKLMSCGEAIWASDLAKRFNLSTSEIWTKLGFYLISKNLNKEMLSLIPEKHKRFMAMFINCSHEERYSLFKEFNLGDPLEYSVLAKRQRGILRAKNLLLAGSTEDAANVLERICSTILTQRDYDFISLQYAVDLLNYSYIVNPTILALSFYVASYKAFWFGYTAIIPKLVYCFVETAKDGPEWLKCRTEELSILSSLSIPSVKKGSIRLRSIRIKDPHNCIRSTGGRSVHCLSGARTPVDIGKKTNSVCTKRFTNNPFTLEDGKSVMSKEEALQWFSVTPFSPLTGHSRLPIF